MVLPEELISYIVEHLAYEPDAPALHLKPEIQFRQISSHLRSLSLVDKRLRRICLPFLFAYVCLHVENRKSIEKFLNRCLTGSVPPVLVKMLKLSGPGISLDKRSHDHLCAALPQLTNLSYAHLDLDGPTSLTKDLFFNILLEHSAVSTILITKSLPMRTTISDLSKVVFDQAIVVPVLSKTFDYLARGVGLARLAIGVSASELFLEKFISTKFKGLRELKLLSYSESVSPSSQSLQTFFLAHPYLQHVSFSDSSPRLLQSNPPAFIASFVEEALQRNLYDSFNISGFGLTRCGKQEWAVTGLKLTISSKLIGILSIVNTSFPLMRDLSIKLQRTQISYEFDDFVAALTDFASLRQLSLHQTFSELSITSEPSWEPIPSRRIKRQNRVVAAKAEARIHWCASRIVQSLPKLEGICVHERVSSGVNWWRFEGWLHPDGLLGDGTVRIAGILDLYENMIGNERLAYRVVRVP